jgi:hypothetical protein
VAIAPLRLLRRDLGAFGMRGAGASRRYVPLRVTRSLGAGAISQTVLVALIAPEHLAAPVEFQVTRAGQPAGAWQPLPGAAPNKGEVITIRLPAGQVAGGLLLAVRAPARADAARMVHGRLRIGV